MLIRATGWENPEQLGAMETDMKTVLNFFMQRGGKCDKFRTARREGRLTEEPAYKEDLDV